MKISDILNEAAVTSYDRLPVKDEEILPMLKKYCSEALTHLMDNPIWRGFSSLTNTNFHAFYVDPSTSERRSQNTLNYYTLLMDNSPFMKGWPKRSRSLICSTSSSTASGYGQPFALFPYNGTRLAWCHSYDIWETRVDIFEDDYRFPQMNRMFAQLGIPDDSFESMEKYTHTPEFGTKLNEVTGMNTTDPNAENYTDPYNFISYVQAQMRPSKTGFQLFTMRQHEVHSSLGGTHEIWFSAPCIALSPLQLRVVKNSL